MTIHNIEQRTPEWFALRTKYPLTASKAQAIATAGKGLETLCWDKKAEEYNIGEKEEYDNEHLKRGRELESEALDKYVDYRGEIETVGFVTDESISKVAGASPDALSETHNIEVKCFADTKYFKLLAEYKATGQVKVESQYEWQMQMQMLFTGKKKSHYVLYNPNYTDSIIIHEVLADEEKQAKIIAGLKKGEEILNEIDEKLGVAF